MYRRKIGNVGAWPFSGYSGRISTAPAQGLGSSSLSPGTKCKAAEHEYSGKSHLKHMCSVKETYGKIHTADVVLEDQTVNWYSP